MGCAPIPLASLVACVEAIWRLAAENGADLKDFQKNVTGYQCDHRLHLMRAVAGFPMMGIGRLAREYAMRSLIKWIDVQPSRLFVVLAGHTALMLGLVLLVAHRL
jgi:hypothetical protein